MSTCAVISCPNSVKGRRNAETVLHCFPKKKGCAEKWVALCGRPPTFQTVKARICSDHFSSRNYERDLFSELKGLPPRKRGFLKENAMPDLFLPPYPRETPNPLYSQQLSEEMMHLPGTDNSELKNVKGSDAHTLPEQPFIRKRKDTGNARPTYASKLHNLNKGRRRMVISSSSKKKEGDITYQQKQNLILRKELEECKAQCERSACELLRFKRKEHLLAMRVQQLRAEVTRLRKAAKQEVSCDAAGIGLIKNIRALLQYGRKRAACNPDGTVFWEAHGINVLYHK